MNNTEMAAEAQAELHIKMLEDTPEGLAKAKEDYIAGFLEGKKQVEEDRAFILAQLKQIMDLAAQYDEFYSLSVVRYTLERIKK